MFKKRSKKPKQGYSKKRKGSNQTEKEYSMYSESDGLMTEPNQKYYTRPNGSDRARYSRQHKQSRYEDQYDNQHSYNYWNRYPQILENTYNDYPTYGYLTEDSQQRHYPEDTKMSMMTETAYSESGTGCALCNKQRNRRAERETDSSEYTSDYSYIEQKNRLRHLQGYDHGQNDSHPYTSATEEIPYRKQFNVYMTHQPIGPDVFTYKQQQTHMQGYKTKSESETMTDEEESEKRKPQEKRQPEYQVYAAHDIGLSQAELFKQLGRERMSVNNYNENIPVMAFKDKESTINRIQSEIVYLPVLVLDNTVNLPKSNILSPESVVYSTRENRENNIKPNMQVYAAMDIGQNNIFQILKNGAGEETSLPSHTKNTLLYNVDLEQLNLLGKGNISAAVAPDESAGSRENIVNFIQQDYPAQKSFTNTAKPALKSKSVHNKTRSKLSLVPSASTTSIKSLVGTSKPGSYKGSGYYSDIHKRDMKARKERRNWLKKHKDGISVNSKALSVVSTTLPEADKQLNNEANATSILMQKPSVQHIGEIQEGTNQEKIVNYSAKQINSKINVPATSTHQTLRKSIVDDMKGLEGKKKTKSTMDLPNERKNTLNTRESLTDIPTNLTGEDKKVPTPKQKKFQNDSQKNEINTKSHKKLFSKPKEKLVHRVESEKEKPSEKRSLSSRLFSRKNKESSKIRSESKRIPGDNRENNEFFTSSSLATNMSHKIGNQDNNHDDRIEEPVYDVLKLWGCDLTPLVIVFQIAQFFMGLSIHDKVMEVISTFQMSGYT